MKKNFKNKENVAKILVRIVLFLVRIGVYSCCFQNPYEYIHLLQIKIQTINFNLTDRSLVEYGYREKSFCFKNSDFFKKVGEIAKIEILQDPNLPQSHYDHKTNDLKSWKSPFYRFSKTVLNQFLLSFCFPKILFTSKKYHFEFLRSRSLSFMSAGHLDPINADPLFYRGSSSMIDFLKFDVDVAEIFWFLISRSEAKTNNKHLPVNSNMECESNPCSHTSLSSKFTRFLTFLTKEKSLGTRKIKIRIEKDCIHLTIFGPNFDDILNYFQSSILRKLWKICGVKSIVWEIYFNLKTGSLKYLKIRWIY